MIDTVHFRVHDLHKNGYLLNVLANSNKNGETIAEVSQISLETQTPKQIRTILFHDNDNIMPILRRSHINLPSFHYSVSYAVNFHKDYIEFNCSLPKYYFATNVLQYINYYNTDSKSTFYKIYQFFEDFFVKRIGYKVKDKYVEIRRIDLCYNQFFNSKEDALTYLHHQKELAAKYARSSRNNFRSYETSLMYVTKRYSFKIYHKGSEFKHHDRKELVKNGNRLGYSINWLQEQADRVLRYELTFRSTYLSYIFKQDYLDGSNKCKQAVLFRSYVKWKPKNASKALDSFMSKGLSFFMASPWDRFDPQVSLTVEYKHETNVTFDASFFDYVYNRFWKKVQDYQLSVRMSIYDVQKKIDAYNEINETKNLLRKKEKSGKDKSRITMIAMLSQFMDVDKLKTVINERTLRRYKQELKQIGIDMYNGNHSIPTPALDYQEYKYLFGKYHQSERLYVPKAAFSLNDLQSRDKLEKF